MEEAGTDQSPHNGARKDLMAMIASSHVLLPLDTLEDPCSETTAFYQYESTFLKASLVTKPLQPRCAHMRS